MMAYYEISKPHTKQSIGIVVECLNTVSNKENEND